MTKAYKTTYMFILNKDLSLKYFKELSKDGKFKKI